MKKTIQLLGALFLFMTSTIFSQTAIVKSSIDSGGGTSTNGGISILYTIGEVNVHETTVGSLHISEGFINPSLKIKVNPKVFLQGPILNPDTAGLMNDDLRSLTYIPTTSPYSDAVTVNATIFDVTGNNAIVDWIWVELRDTTDNTNVKSAQSALLQRDGDVVTLDGVSDLSFNLAISSYYVVIKHRNHLGVMSANPIALSSTATLVDFTDSNFATYGNHAQVQLANGAMAMWTGDTSNENKIKFSGSGNGANFIKGIVLNDATNGFNSATFTSTGYLTSDLDLDGGAKFSGSNNDSNIIKGNVLNHASNGFNSPTYTINATVPAGTLLNRNTQRITPINIYLPPSEIVKRENELDALKYQ